MTASTVKHSTFVIERDLPGSPKHAFRFWSEPELKETWTRCHPDWIVLEDRFDFRIGGEEAKRWRTSEGEEQAFHARYLDIAPERRIIYAFAMSFKGQNVSASLATVEFVAAEAMTRMVFTEQIAFLGDDEAYRMRVAGTEIGFNKLVEVMRAAAPT
jgi:uncharacterized protein YndB with AHSA1/START domain